MSEAEKNAELFFSQKPVRKRETDRDQDIGLHKEAAIRPNSNRRTGIDRNISS